MIQTAVHCLQLPDSSTVQSCSFSAVQNSNCVVVLALHYITFNTLKCKLRRGAVGNEVHLGWLLLGEWSTSHLPNEWTWENTAGKIKKEYKIGKYQISSGTQNVPAGGEKYKFCHGVDFWSIWWLRSWPNICQRFLPSSRATRCLSWSMSAPAQASKHASDVWPARISRWDGQSWSISADGFKCKQSHVSNKTSLPHSMPVRVLLLLLLLLLLPARKYVPK